MECVAKIKRRPSLDTEKTGSMEGADQVYLILYGVCEEYYPLAGTGAVDFLLGEIRKEFQGPNVEFSVISHSNKFCWYVHPTRAWVKCDFEGDFNGHCLEVCENNIESASATTLRVPFNAVADDPGYRRGAGGMWILSETHFEVQGTKKPKHISKLTEPEHRDLYRQLSLAYNTYIASSGDFDQEMINIAPESKIFFIPSILRVLEDGKAVKSIYSREERFEQTLQQAKSIKEKVKDSVVVLLELSYMTLRQIHEISRYCDAVVFFAHDILAQKYSKDRNKNKAEIYLQSFMLDRITKPFSHFCKFGGRYSLTGLFDADVFFSDRPSFRLIPRAYDGHPIIESILYSIPHSCKAEFEKVLKEAQNTLEAQFTDVEHLLYSLYAAKVPVNWLEVLGIRGHFAGSGAYNPS